MSEYGDHRFDRKGQHPGKRIDKHIERLDFLKLAERLPQHETAFAMTIHKSQGSEFNRVLILLPPVDSVLLTRELIYTGITRAKHSLEIWTDQTVFCSAVRKKIERSSGLKDLLHNHS